MTITRSSRGPKKAEETSAIGHLLQAGRRTGKWLSRNLNAFQVCGPRGLEPSKLKRFGELAIAFACARRWHRDALVVEPAELDRWGGLLCREVTASAYGQSAMRNPGQCLYFLLPYLALRQSGHSNQALDRFLEWSLANGFLRQSERTPYRKLELEYLLWKAGVLTKEPDWDSLSRQTILANCPSQALLDVADAYAITHSIFYLSDWGFKEVALSRPIRHRTVQVLHVLLVHFWRLGHWDLVGETLMALHMMRHRETLLLRDVRDAFLALSHSGGAVAGTADLTSSTPSPSVKAKSKSSFELFYHTTLVQFLLCGTVLTLWLTHKCGQESLPPLVCHRAG